MDVYALEDTVIALFQNRSTWKEGLHLEFKSAKGGLPKELWPTYSAFANTKGGIIVLGVQDDGSVEGVKNLKQRRLDFINTANNPSKCSINLCEDEDIAEVTLDGKQVLAIRVPQADCAVRPVSVNDSKICYKRFEETDQRCTARDLDVLISERFVVTNDSYTEDDAILEHTSLEDIDLHTLNQYRNRLQSAKPDNPWSDKEPLDFLLALNAYRRDRKTGKEGLTLAGLLMFGNARALMELKPSLQLDYQEYEELEPSNISCRWVDRLENDGTWDCNLYQFFFKVLPKLTLGLKTPFALDSSLIRVDESPAHVAVRETLANTLIHAAYREECVIKILKTPQGFIFTNSGNLLLSEEQMMKGGLSRCRNKRIQNMFRFIGIVDKAGSGIAKIQYGWKQLCLFPPQVVTKNNPDMVQWILPFVGFASKETTSQILTQIPDSLKKYMDVKDHIIISQLSDGGWHNNKSLRKLYPIHSQQMGKILTKLKKYGIIVSRGNSNAMEYSLSPKYQRLSENDSDVNKHIHSSPKDTAKSEKLLTELSPALRRKIEQLKSSKRYDSKVVLRLIMEICANRYVSSVQLATLLNRTPDYVRNNYIKILLLSNKMEQLYPEDNHPEQVYRCSNS